MTPYYEDDAVTLYHGDALTTLAGFDSGIVDCIVTSPPYFGLRDYGVEGQYGLEESPAEYVETMRAVFAEARRVLAADGTLWLNIGDSYYSGRGNPGPNSADEKQSARRGWVRPQDRCSADWAKPKDLLGIPWRVAFALQDDGWTLRNAIVWHKVNGMPESVTDRLRTSYEMVFMFSRARTYWFGLDGIREPHGARPHTARLDQSLHPEGRNPGDVWAFPTQPFAAAHFAVMPIALAQRCISAGCKPGGVVLDPFSGSGTTGLAATRLGRRYVGIDLNPEYIDLSLQTRLAQSALLDGEAS